MDEILGKFSPVTITRERLEELLTAESDAERLKNLIRQKVERFEGFSFTELQLLAAFLKLDAKDPFAPDEPDEREDIENGNQ